MFFTMDYFSKNIKFLRKQRKLGQSKLAELLGVSRDNVASYERGSSPGRQVIVRIVNLFQVDFTDLVEKDLETLPSSTYTLAEKSDVTYQPTQNDYELEIQSLKKIIEQQAKHIKMLEHSSKSGSKSK